MLYTIGHRESYEKYFAEQTPPDPMKLGSRRPGEHPNAPDGYDGGAVWETRHEAERVCPPGYAVYGVEADWTADTWRAGRCHAEQYGDPRFLTRDARLVKLPDAGNNSATRG